MAFWRFSASEYNVAVACMETVPCANSFLGMSLDYMFLRPVPAIVGVLMLPVKNDREVSIHGFVPRVVVVTHLSR